MRTFVWYCICMQARKSLGYLIHFFCVFYPLWFCIWIIKNSLLILSSSYVNLQLIFDAGIDHVRSVYWLNGRITVKGLLQKTSLTFCFSFSCCFFVCGFDSIRQILALVLYIDISKTSTVTTTGTSYSLNCCLIVSFRALQTLFGRLTKVFAVMYQFLLFFKFGFETYFVLIATIWHNQVELYIDLWVGQEALQ